MKVFLGGTTVNSKWRDEIKSLLTIDYFDPVVDDWNEESRNIEKIEKSKCDVHLYTLTPEIQGIFSIAEATESANKMPERTILCILNEYGNSSFNEGMSRSMKAFIDLIESNNVKVFYSLEDTANYLNNLTDIHKLDLTNMYPVFLDTEFTQLSQNTKLISIGMTDLNNNTFYSEVLDHYTYDDCSEWVQENILNVLKYTNKTNTEVSMNYSGASDIKTLRNNVMKWFTNISKDKQILIISDCLAYDWILFSELVKDDAGEFPFDKIFYVPVDIMGILMAKGIDIDADRESLVNSVSDNKHNSLHDAIIIKEIFNKYL